MIQIPSTLDQAKGRLTEIEGIVTAKGWERAAIVWAFTLQANDHVGENPHKISFRAFAALGIVGLRDHGVVGKYHDAWQAALDAGKAKAIEPGDRVEIPDLPWPYPSRYEQEHLTPERRAAIESVVGPTGPAVGSVARVIDQPSAVAAAIRADEKLAAVAEDALSERRIRVVDRRIPKGEPIPSLVNETQRDLWQAMEALLCARDDARRAVRLVTSHGKLIGDSAALIEEPVANIRAALDLLDSYLASGGITDVALESWLAGDAS